MMMTTTMTADDDADDDDHKGGDSGREAPSQSCRGRGRRYQYLQTIR